MVAFSGQRAFVSSLPQKAMLADDAFSVSNPANLCYVRVLTSLPFLRCFSRIHGHYHHLHHRVLCYFLCERRLTRHRRLLNDSYCDMALVGTSLASSCMLREINRDFFLSVLLNRPSCMFLY